MIRTDMFATLCYLVAISTITSASFSRLKIPLSRNILDFEPLNITRLYETTTDDTPTSRILYLEFDAFEQRVNITLFHRPTFSHDYSVVTLTHNGTEEKNVLPVSHSFRTDDNLAAITLDGTRDGIIRGFVKQGHDFFHIIPVEEAYASKEKILEEAIDLIESSGTKHIIFRDIDLISDPDELCDSIDDPSVESTFTNHTSPHLQLDPDLLSSMYSKARRQYSISPPPAPCPRQQLELKVAFAADHGFLSLLRRSGQNFQSWLDSTMNIISALYLRTVNISVRVSKVYVPGQIGIPLWNSPRCTNIYSVLDSFSLWRGTSTEAKSRPEGLFHLMSSCFTGGAVGLAWLSSVCTRHVQSGYYSGTGVSSGGDLGWRILAHEMGHQLGAPHVRDRNDQGIMFPTTSMADKFTRVTQNNICHEISKQHNRPDSCFSTPTYNCISRCRGDCGLYGCCGSDGCSGSCGSCTPNGRCSNGKCMCTPNCNNRQCGDDGCGRQCGTCRSSQSCVSSTCVNTKDSSEATYLAIHNEVRTTYNLTPLRWSSMLASRARDWVNKCSNSINFFDKGYNIGFWRWPSPQSSETIINTALSYWLENGKNWDCETDSCPRCSHCRTYTQMIHEDVKEMGCAYAFCKNTGYYYIMCLYDVNGKYASSRPFSPNKCVTSSGGRPDSCQPKETCASAGIQCGSFYDGCNTQECGECGAGSTCNNNKCECVPITSCEAQGMTCGTINIGCGRTAYCGSCSNGNVCDENHRCDNKCVPSTSCKAQGRTCGVINNGCDREICGMCTDGFECKKGSCTACSGCHNLATCESDKCQCRSGYTGNGFYCRAIVDPTITDVGFNGALTQSINNMWGIFCGNNDVWLLGPKSVIHVKESADVGVWSDATPLFKESVVSFVVRIKKNKGAHRLGLTWKMMDCKNYFRTYWDEADKSLKTSMVLNGETTERVLDDNIEWRDEDLKTFHLDIVGNSGVVIGFENKQHKCSSDYLVDANGFGVYAAGPAEFQDVVSFTKTNVTMTLVQCMTVEEFRIKIANLLSIPVVQVSNIVASTNCLSRRDVAATTFAPLTYSFTLSGSSTATSAALASMLTVAVEQQSSSLSAAGLIATAATVAVPAIGAGAIAFSATAAAVSTVHIAGAISATVAGVLICVIIGVIYGKKRRSQSSTDSFKLEEEESVYAKKTHGIDVINPEVYYNRPVSLTQRNMIGYTPNDSSVSIITV